MRPLVSTTWARVIAASTGNSAIECGRVSPLTNSSVKPRSANAGVLLARATASVTTTRILMPISLFYLQHGGEKSEPAHHDRTIGGGRRLLDVGEIRLRCVARALLLLVYLAEAAICGRERGVGLERAPIDFLGAFQVRGVCGSAFLGLKCLGQALRPSLTSAVAQIVSFVGVGQRVGLDRALRAHALPRVAEQDLQPQVARITRDERLRERDGRVRKIVLDIVLDRHRAHVHDGSLEPVIVTLAVRRFGDERAARLGTRTNFGVRAPDGRGARTQALVVAAEDVEYVGKRVRIVAARAQDLDRAVVRFCSSSRL